MRLYRGQKTTAVIGSALSAAGVVSCRCRVCASPSNSLFVHFLRLAVVALIVLSDENLQVLRHCWSLFGLLRHSNSHGLLLVC